MKKYRIDEITINLDNKRKPLNNKERKAISKFKLYPYYGANNIVDYVDEYIFDEEILCVAEDGGSWGYNEECAYIVNQKCWVNNHAHVLKAKNNLNIRYLSYYLNFKNLSNVITGTTRGKLTKSALNSIEILLPELNKQDKIVEILEKSKELMDKRKEQIEALDELVKSKFIEMFGDPIRNNMNWEIKKVGDIAFVTKLAGFEYTQYINYQDEGEVVVVKGLNVKEKKLKLDNVSYIDKETSNLLPRSQLKKNDLVMTYVGINIGDVALVDGKNRYHLAPNVAKISLLKESNINPVFMVNLLYMSRILFSSGATSTAKQALNMGRIREIDIMMPPVELQNQFADFVKQVDKLKFEMEKSLKELEDSFNSLMQRAFNGELF